MWDHFCASFWGRFSEYLTRPRYDDMAYLLDRISEL